MSMQGLIRRVEWIGNKLPHPFTLFLLLAALTAVTSFVLNKLGVSVAYVAGSSADGDAPGQTLVAVKNLLCVDVLRGLLTRFVDIYVGFAPLGLILTMMLGIGLVEQTGLISALMRKTILGAPRFLVTVVLCFVGVNSNLASDAGVVFTPTLGAALFKALGRDPWVGIMAGFAAASGGFTANIFVAGTDALLAGITESTLAGTGISAPTHPLINWYFMIAATAVVTLVTTAVTEGVTARVLGEKDSAGAHGDVSQHRLSAAEDRGLRFALVATLGCLAVGLIGSVPKSGFLRNDAGDLLPQSPLTTGIVALLFVFFFVVSVAYGWGAGTIRSEKDIPKLMQEGMRGVLSFLVIALPAAVFIHLFKESHLTTVIAVKGAQLLGEMQIGGFLLVVLFIVLSALLNLFVVSGSAKWLVLAPIFVPMLAVAGLSPALSQLAYRIGDSSTNIISPLSYYIPVIIGLLEQYRSDTGPSVGIGTVIALELPYAAALLLSLGALLGLWYAFGLPLGPGAPVGMG